ncbi:DUF2793 domain-containing protein [Sulfitobacter sp. D35]|uniref:DUF2793 domain-containing protein n=1 Tax=Sulfitobacter sp. D35 TaxID=3083252 RepID=UPI00296EE737|nr:DUF2793 domain-containing protein [Sulfitobacter sp. D35]MDW4498124.1 DUF2793 domain-containing protein [Sulfitobacter sp. D35]
MSETSPILSLPYIQPSQAQKHVTHNEALRLLDVVTQLGVVSDEMTGPPAAPQTGDRYILPPTPSGAWAGQGRAVALYDAGAWIFHAPRAGWRAYVLDRQILTVFDGTDWIDLDDAEFQDIEALGLGMASLPGTPFSAKLNAALWTALYDADGGNGSLMQTLNRETSADDAGLVLQTDFSTRALIGHFGSDRLRLATSPDGASFRDGISIDGASGIVDQPTLPRFAAYTNFDNFGAADAWTTLSINTAEYNDQLAFDAGTGAFTAPVDGTYVFGAALVFKLDSNAGAKMGGRLLVNGANVMRGSRGQISAAHEDQETTLSIHAFAALSAGDTVELQGRMRDFSGYFLGGETAFWGAKIG